MRKKFRIWISTLVVLSAILIISNGCHKGLNVIVPSTVTDFDGNVYHTVTIGTQVWLVENLKSTHYRNGNPIPNVTDTAAWNNLHLTNGGASCYYNNDPSNAATYGLLYNYYAVVDTDSIAPRGFHIPGETEWTTLTTYLGNIDSDGGKMKETGILHWQSPNTGATNATLFTGLPAGERLSHGAFTGIGTTGAWWSSSGDGSYDAWGRYINYNDSAIFRYDDTKLVGFSVRCVMDYPTSLTSTY